MVVTEIGFHEKYYIFREELYNAFLILLGKKGENGILNIKDLGVRFVGKPIAYMKVSGGSLYFFTDNDEECYGFYSKGLEDMCRLYDDIVKALKENMER